MQKEEGRKQKQDHLVFAVLPGEGDLGAVSGDCRPGPLTQRPQLSPEAASLPGEGKCRRQNEECRRFGRRREAANR